MRVRAAGVAEVAEVAGVAEEAEAAGVEAEVAGVEAEEAEEAEEAISSGPGSGGPSVAQPMRNLVCRLMDQTGNILFEMAAANVAASLTSKISYGAGMTAAATANFIAVAAPDMPLHGTSKNTSIYDFWAA